MITNEMNNEVNKALENRWYVVAASGSIIDADSKAGARNIVTRHDREYSRYAPHYAVQLQVKGTLPEGALMPSHQVGSLVAIIGSDEKYQITSAEPSYRLRRVSDGSEMFGVFPDGKIKPTPPPNPVYDDFEEAFDKLKGEIAGLSEYHAWLIWQSAQENNIDK